MKQKNTAVSIIIPTLNEEKFIGHLLHCLSNQTYSDFEVIVVDGKSDDKTKHAVSLYQKKLGIQFVESKKRNVAFQRNIGVKHAASDTLLFLDADVTLQPYFIEKSLDELRRRKAQLAIPQYHPLDKSWHYHVFFGFINFTFWLTQKIKPCGTGMAIFSNKDLHNQSNGFSQSLTCAEDIDYISRISKRGKFIVLNTTIDISARRFERRGTKKTIKEWLTIYGYYLQGKIEKANNLQYFKD